jgi:hypothetical protein
MRNGLVAMIAVLMTLPVPRGRLTLPVSGGSCQARLLAWQLKAAAGTSGRCQRAVAPVAAAQQDQRECAAMRSGTTPGEATGTREEAEGGRAR